MDFKSLYGNTNIPVIGLGTWEMGGGFERDEKNDTRGIAAIKKAIELGYTHIDTAEMYGKGQRTETLSNLNPDTPVGQPH